MIPQPRHGRRLTTQEYRARDPRVLCRGCNTYMRFSPTANSPSMRRPKPHADSCTDCPPSRVCAEGCSQCVEEEPGAGQNDEHNQARAGDMEAAILDAIETLTGYRDMSEIREVYDRLLVLMDAIDDAREGRDA